MRVLIFFFLLNSVASFGAALDKGSSLLVKNILETTPESIEFYHDGKFYLKKEHLQLTDKGILLNAGIFAIPLQEVDSNQYGFFLMSQIDRQTGPKLIPVICKNCSYKWLYSELSRTTCPRCGSSP